MKIIRTIVVAIVVLVAVVLLGKNVIARIAVTRGVKAVTGLRLEIKSLEVGLRSTMVRVKGLRVMNPPGFTDPVMLDAPEIYVNYDLGSLLKGHPHLEEVRLNLEQLTVVRNRQGELNLNSLRSVKETKKAASPQTPPSEKKPAETPSIQIDVLNLDIGKVVYKDYTAGPTPSVREFNLGVHERFEHITNPSVLGSLIVSRALTRTALANLGDLRSFQSDLVGALKQQTGSLNAIAGDALSTVDGTVHGATGAAEQAVKGASDVLRRTLGQ